MINLIETQGVSPQERGNRITWKKNQNLNYCWEEYKKIMCEWVLTEMNIHPHGEKSMLEIKMVRKYRETKLQQSKQRALRASWEIKEWTWQQLLQDTCEHWKHPFEWQISLSHTADAVALRTDREQSMENSSDTFFKQNMSFPQWV